MNTEKTFHSITTTPPADTLLVVRDAEGREALGFATFYPFRFEGKQMVRQENTWDGNFMTHAKPGTLEAPEIGKIVEWAEMPEQPGEKELGEKLAEVLNAAGLTDEQRQRECLLRYFFPSLSEAEKMVLLHPTMKCHENTRGNSGKD